MRAHALKNQDFPAKKRKGKRKLATRTAPPGPPPPSPPAPPANPDLYFKAAWTDSGWHRSCDHYHATLIEAARCAEPTGCGWYVFAIENGHGRQLTNEEDEIVNGYRFRK